MSEAIEKLLNGLQDNNIRALSRLITYVENDPLIAAPIFRQLPHPKKQCRVLGVTGAPGAGKSTFVSCLLEQLANTNTKVAVIAVDPSSPFKGGALLGDRIRMRKFNDNPHVFIRSMATRGALGGLTSSIWQTIALLEVFGFDYVIIETVGVGQSEIEIANVADCTLLLSVPGLGDDIQVMKAGIMEIADMIILNKADLEGSDKTIRDLETFQMHLPQEQQIPILTSISNKGVGFEAITRAIEDYFITTQSNGFLQQRRNERFDHIVKMATTLVFNQKYAAYLQTYPIDHNQNDDINTIAKAFDLAQHIADHIL